MFFQVYHFQTKLTFLLKNLASPQTNISEIYQIKRVSVKADFSNKSILLLLFFTSHSFMSSVTELIDETRGNCLVGRTMVKFELSVKFQSLVMKTNSISSTSFESKRILSVDYYWKTAKKRSFSSTPHFSMSIFPRDPMTSLCLTYGSM